MLSPLGNDRSNEINGNSNKLPGFCKSIYQPDDVSLFMAQDPVTIKDLARILKISVSTVSTALRDTIGKEMGVIGFANDPSSRIISPTLSTMSVPSFEIVRISCELLLKHIKKNNFQPQKITLPGLLIARESTFRE